MKHDFQLTFRDDETGELHVETFTVEETTTLSIDFFYFAWDKAMYYGFNVRGYTLLAMCMMS